MTTSTTDRPTSQKPYVSKDSDGWHVLNSSGHIVITFDDCETAQTYLRTHWNILKNSGWDHLTKNS